MQRFFNPSELVSPIGYFVLLLLFFFSCQSPDPDLGKGNHFYQNKKYEEAVPYYKKVLGKKDRTDHKEAIHHLELSLFHAGVLNHRSKHYKKAIKYLDHLLIAFSESEYKKKAQELLNRSYFQLGEKAFNENNYQKAIKSLRLLQTQSAVNDELKGKSDKYLAESLYHTALNHLKDKEYWLARERFLVLKYDFPHSMWMKKANNLLQESFYKDGQSQYGQKAYGNALRIFKSLMNLYPKGIYTGKAKEYIRQIEKLSKAPKTDSKAKKDVSIKRYLQDKGHNKNNPFENKDILTLIKYLNKESARNVEYAKNEVYHHYLNKHVNLKSLEITGSEKVVNMANTPAKGFKDFMKNYTAQNKKKPMKSYHFKYIVTTKTIGNVFVYLKKKDYYDLDINKKEIVKKLDVRGLIYAIKGNNSVKIFIVPEFVKTYNLSSRKSKKPVQ